MPFLPAQAFFHNFKLRIWTVPLVPLVPLFLSQSWFPSDQNPIGMRQFYLDRWQLEINQTTREILTNLKRSKESVSHKRPRQVSHKSVKKQVLPFNCVLPVRLALSVTSVCPTKVSHKGSPQSALQITKMLVLILEKRSSMHVVLYYMLG